MSATNGLAVALKKASKRSPPSSLKPSPSPRTPVRKTSSRHTSAKPASNGVGPEGLLIELSGATLMVSQLLDKWEYPGSKRSRYLQQLSRVGASDQSGLEYALDVT